MTTGPIARAVMNDIADSVLYGYDVCDGAFYWLELDENGLGTLARVPHTGDQTDAAIMRDAARISHLTKQEDV